MHKPKKLAKKNFLSNSDMSSQEIEYLFFIAKKFKEKNLTFEFSNKVLGLIFDKSSTALGTISL